MPIFVQNKVNIKLDFYAKIYYTYVIEINIFLS
jgi:hypothetical protein